MSNELQKRPYFVLAVNQKVIDELHEKFPSYTELKTCLVTKYENDTSYVLLMVTMSLSSSLTQTFAHFLLVLLGQ